MSMIPISQIERTTILKLTRRFAPFLVICYFFTYIDRVNLGFAASSMERELHFSATLFSQAAGIFFWTYFLFEIPSNLVLARVGARKWIARIMMSWALVSASTAWISSETGLLILRALLGAAEAGFFPGVIYFLTLWFPAAYRSRILGWFLFAVPASSVLGAPLSYWLLNHPPIFGLAGWRLLFVAEALPCLILSVIVWFYLTDRPADADWLTDEERHWLAKRLDEDAERSGVFNSKSLFQVLSDPRVLSLGLVYGGIVAGLYGLGFFLPQIVEGFGRAIGSTGWFIAAPYAIAAIGMVLWARSADGSGRYRRATIVAIGAMAIGLGMASLTDAPLGKMAAITIATIGCFSALPVFWVLPTAFLSGAAAASGIALINSIGNLAGYFGPTIMGVTKDLTGDYNDGLMVLAGLAALSGALVAGMRLQPKETA